MICPLRAGTKKRGRRGIPAGLFFDDVNFGSVGRRDGSAYLNRTLGSQVATSGKAAIRIRPTIWMITKGMMPR